MVIEVHCALMMPKYNSLPTKSDLSSDSVPKVAIVADWIIGGGAERVVQALHEIYPNAPIYAAYCTDEWRKKLDNVVVTGYLQKLGPLRKYLPLLQYWWFRALNLKKYDIIISSSGNGMSKAVNVSAESRHIVYCHTPVHYLWRHYEEYIKRPGFGSFDPIARIGLKLLVAPLRKLDFKAAQHADVFIANSNHIKNDIKNYYKRNSIVIHPPVDTKRFKPSAKKRIGFVTVGRLVPMKYTNIIIEACNELKVPLKVVGSGPEFDSLKSIAGPTVELLGKASDKTVEQSISGAVAFLFASFEDFGITPVEAMAAGTPVIAYGKGGALDYINDVTGALFVHQKSKDIVNAIKLAQKRKWNHKEISELAKQFDTKMFKRSIQDIVSEV